MKRVVNFMHIERPSNFSTWLQESQSSLRLLAISSSPEIFLMLLRARERRVMYLSGGKLTILSMQLEEMESFSTRVRVLRTLVSSRSIGGFCLRGGSTRKTSLISSASAAGLLFFYYHRLRALLSGIPRPAIQTCKFYYYSIRHQIRLNYRGDEKPLYHFGQRRCKFFKGLWLDVWDICIIMYHNLGAQGHERNLRRIGEAGPMNWQQGVMCSVIGWRRFSNSTWEKEHQGYRREVEQRLEQLRVSMNYPQIINRFLTHTLVTLLLSTLLFVAAFLLPEDWELIRTIAIWQYVLWCVVYFIWSLVMVKVLRGKIRSGFREIETAIPELRLSFSVFCDCCCGCINQNYVSVYLNE